MVKVVNLRNEPYTLYVGRFTHGVPQSSPFKNPFVMTYDLGRRDIVLRFAAYFYAHEQRYLRDLAVKSIPEDAVLGCWCHPLECHADIVAGYVNWKRAQSRYLVCDRCRQTKPDVCERPDGYAQDIYNEPDATWTACDKCDQYNNDDI